MIASEVARFVEVTAFHQGRSTTFDPTTRTKTLLNVASIHSIIPHGDGAQIHLTTDRLISVTESYDQLKEMLLA